MYKIMSEKHQENSINFKKHIYIQTIPKKKEKRKTKRERGCNDQQVQSTYK